MSSGATPIKRWQRRSLAANDAANRAAPWRFWRESVFYVLFFALTLSGLCGSASAATLATPRGPVLLSIVGRIDRTNAPGRADFDRSMLLGLGVEGFVTHTKWTDGPQRFEGVRLSRVLDAVGARGGELKASALDDYQITIPVADARTWPVLVALKRNGNQMPVRDKGPLWLVYPRDSDPRLRDDRHDGRWIWQLRRLEVR